MKSPRLCREKKKEDRPDAKGTGLEFVANSPTHLSTTKPVLCLHWDKVKILPWQPGLVSCQGAGRCCNSKVTACVLVAKLACLGERFGETPLSLMCRMPCLSIDFMWKSIQKCKLSSRSGAALAFYHLSLFSSKMAPVLNCFVCFLMTKRTVFILFYFVKDRITYV